MRLTINPQDDESLNRIINYPARGIGNNTMAKLQSYAVDNNLSLWETINRLSSTALLAVQMGIKDATVKKITDFKDLIESFIAKVNTENAYSFTTEILKLSGMISDLKTDQTPEGISRMGNIEELLNSIKEYTKIAENKADGAMIAEYLQNVSLITDMDKDSSKEDDRVTLMTIHSAKGLEFKYIYIVGMEEGLFPGNNSIQSEHSLEEERRLFYVALTRAAFKATISFAQTRYRWGNVNSSTPSRFLRDIDAAYMSADSISDFLSNEKRYSPSNFSYNNFRANTVNRNLKPLQPKQKEQPEEVGTTSTLTPGMEVEHARFGRGRVIEIEIEGNGARAKIEFYTAGLKTLILRYAQLSIASKPE
jgi:DNA helicase-2/ATP-dependent DNA helicase PcrA